MAFVQTILSLTTAAGLCALAHDRYIGLDIDQRILTAGREQLADNIVETKRPTLEVINKERLAARGGEATALGLLEGVFCSAYCLRKSWTTILRASLPSLMPVPPACCFHRSSLKAGRVSVED